VVSSRSSAAVDPRILAGIATLGAIAILIGGAFAGLIAEGAADFAGAAASLDAYFARIALFTLWQAALSTLLSVGPAILVARALSRHPAFPGRRLVLRLFALPLALPAIVAALGVLSLYGRAGYFAGFLSQLSGGEWPGIYGLSGILVAHVFFNLPLATRFLLEALDAVPADQWRLASQLGMGAGPSFRFVEWPALGAALPGVAGLVFMLCVTSFTVVLTLGGGPWATTLEVAIYQALRFDFDPARAVTLTAGQIALTVLAVWLLAKLGADPARDANLGVSPRRYLSVTTPETLANAVLILLSAGFVIGPMAAVLVSGLSADLARLAGEASVQSAALTSLVLATISASLAVLMSLALVGARHALEGKRRGTRGGTLLERAVDTGAGFVLVVPPVVIGAGWFVLFLGIGDVFLLAPFMVIAVNAVMAMPFVVRAIRPAHDTAAERHDRLAASLGISGWNRFSLVDWPSIRRPLATGFVFAMALSLGDLGVIALFGSDAVKTLPFLLLERMGSYRTADAAGLALVIGLVCLTLITVADHFARERR
jgi:thiamine transport system permease protein